MSSSTIVDDATRNESGAADDADTLRERYQELISELRLILPGVQVLFAFLITTPFSGRFGELNDGERGLFGVSLATSTLALVVLLTPVAYHRLSHAEDREDRIRVAIRLKMVGLTLLAVSMTAALAAVASFVYSLPLGVATGGSVVVIVVASWLVFPVTRGHARSTSRRS